MEEKLIQQVAKIIEDWNPLGEMAKTIKDLDGYRTEAIDILFTNQLIFKGNIKKALIDILEEAFDIEIALNEAESVANKIEKIIKK